MEAGPGSSLASGRPRSPAPLLRVGAAGQGRQRNPLLCVFTAADELAVKPQWRCREDARAWDGARLLASLKGFSS